VGEQDGHQLTRARVAEEVTQAQYRHDGAVGGKGEPLGSNLDQTGPSERLNEAIADPGQGEEGKSSAQHEENREEDRTGHAAQEVALAAEQIGEAAGGELADGIRQHAQRCNRAEANLRLSGRDAMPRLIGDDQRQGNRVVGAAEVIAGVAEAEQRDGEDVPTGELAARPLAHGRSPRAMRASISSSRGSACAALSMTK
jgi:hypothetical protein